jgi:23S rRNA pseudouridine2605 synthase
MEERLQKYMARCGVASRRKSEEIIARGKVKVNKIVITELGFKVDGDTDSVEVDGKLIKPEEKKLYIALNKPEGYISSVSDEKGRRTIMELVEVDERIYPIGRLDYDTTGLILLTNDGEIYNKIIHPRMEKNKVYEAIIEGFISSEEINKLETGIDIGGYVTAPAKVKLIAENRNSTEVEITIHEGKNKQIRKMFEAVEHNIIRLKRISIGEIKLGNLKEGLWRNLTEDELAYIRNM